MMKTFTFNQRSQKKSKILFICYLLFLVAVIVFVASGAFGLLDFINSFKKVTIPTIIAGVILLLPIFLLAKLTKRKITIQISPESIKITDKEVIIISTGKIDKVIINEPRPKTVNLFSKDKLLFCFDSGDGEESLKELTNAIVENIGNVEKKERKRKVANGEIDIIEYVKI